MRKDEENRQQLLNNILGELNNPSKISTLISRILSLIKEHTDIEAVGIRLREGEDFPYYETEGFPGYFIEAERHLCARDGNNEIIRDSVGNPFLECMCGNIICGRTDPSLPFFTEGGSFWSNNTTKLLASTSEKDRQARTRNRCNSEGYESVALIPLKYGENIIGLLQLNDKRPDRFTCDMIQFIEKIGTSIGIAISRKVADELISNKEAKLRKIIEQNLDGMVVVNFEGVVLFVNPAAESIFGLPEKEVVSSNFGFPIAISQRTEIDIIRPSGQGMVSVEMSIVDVEWDGKPSYLVSLHDITERKQAEVELQKTLERLRKAFGTTVQVMVAAVEAKDPYTAGHQLRTANIARAIATEMGLPPEKIEGIRMAGSIHDIGKLSVPAEILTKPTKLTELEFSMIKEHARKGYEILKDVESPWPLAQIVYQHHERMNGSGYPRKLKGDEILIEARIMAVADVVEAMASYRPYRPALGIETALEEIEKNRGTFYDADAVDACLKLFREKGYQLERT